MLLRPCNSGTGHAGKRYETTKREKEERQTERERNRKTERERERARRDGIVRKESGSGE